jgi:hypothetical protein
MNIQYTGYPVAVSKQLVAIISQERCIRQPEIESGFIINFQDPDYDFQSGGYHPVEIYVNAQGCIQYITDFSYIGNGQFAQLAKELNFDFAKGIFEQMGTVFPIQQGAGLFRLWQANFCAYHKAQVFQSRIQLL